MYLTGIHSYLEKTKTHVQQLRCNNEKQFVVYSISYKVA